MTILQSTGVSKITEKFYANSQREFKLRKNVQWKENIWKLVKKL